jgi:cell division protein ZipA
MDISTFRWILIIAGVVVLALIFLLGSPERKKKRASRKLKARPNKKRSDRERREPVLETSAEQAGDEDEFGSSEGLQPELDIAVRDEQKENRPPPGPPPDKIITLFLQARDNHRISGVDLLEAALKSGMVFGERDIFHRVADGGEEIIFSMANLTKPGHFDKTAWNTLETIGVTMFMTLPGPLSALDAWDAMLATSRRVAELLHADLLDDRHSTFTRQREGQIREELRDYLRSQQAEG